MHMCIGYNYVEITVTVLNLAAIHLITLWYAFVANHKLHSKVLIILNKMCFTSLICAFINSTYFSSQYLLIAPNHFDKSPDNQTVTLQCPVTSHPSPVISWYLNRELVNLTDYNITDMVDNNTWIIQGGDPYGLIGYWHCFATNEAGTVHHEIRVLPYGLICNHNSLAQ